MRLSLECKPHVKETRQQGSHTVLNTHRISTVQGPFNLPSIGRMVAAQNGPVFHNHPTLQAFSIRNLCTLLQLPVPPSRIKQRFRIDDVIPTTSCIPERSVLPDQNTVKLTFHPFGRSI